MCLSFSQHVQNSSHHCDTRQRECIKVLAMLSSPRDKALYWTPAHHQTGVSLLWLAHREATPDAFRAETYTGALDKSGTAAFACEVDHNTLFVVLWWWYNWPEQFSILILPVAQLDPLSCFTTSKRIFLPSPLFFELLRFSPPVSILQTDQAGNPWQLTSTGKSQACHPPPLQPCRSSMKIIFFASSDHSPTSGLRIVWTTWRSCGGSPRLTFIFYDWAFCSRLVVVHSFYPFPYKLISFPKKSGILPSPASRSEQVSWSPSPGATCTFHMVPCVSDCKTALTCCVLLVVNVEGKLVATLKLLVSSSVLASGVALFTEEISLQTLYLVAMWKCFAISQ